jgi:hypothetical protein
MGRPPILGTRPLTNSEKHKRYMARLRERAAAGDAGNEPAKAPATTTEDAIVAWWKDASDQERRWLLEEIGISGPEGLACALWKCDDWSEYIQHCAALTLAEHAEELGYWRIPEGINANEFEEWLESNGYADWLRSKGVDGA